MTMNELLQSFEENSIIWIIVSAGIGGLVGALIKFLFEKVISTNYQYKFDTRSALKKYKYPILRSADSLDHRLQNYIQFIEKKWYDNKKEDYYRASTLYLIGSYFGWCKILEDEAFIEFETSHSRARKFNTMFNTVYKGLTGFQYFSKVDDLPMSEVEAASIPRLTITAISELMVKKSDEKEKGSKPRVLEFIEFANCLDKSPDFAKWFGDFDKLLRGVHPGLTAKWNRILVFATNVRAFVAFLDPSKRMTTPRAIYYLKQMHPQVREYVKKELESHGFAKLISKDDK